MKTISLSKFKNGITMEEVSEMFFSDWEANRFQTEAVLMGLIIFKPLTIKKEGEKYVYYFGKFYLSDNKSIKSVIVDSRTGAITKINKIDNKSYPMVGQGTGVKKTRNILTKIK